MARSHRNTARPGNDRGWSMFAVLLATLTATAAIAEVAPRGQRTASDIKYGDWRKLCFKPGGAPTVCRTSITGTFETGQTAVRIDLIEREGGAARLQVFVPVGMYLPPGIKLRVDDGGPLQLPYTWCLANACIAAEAADAKLTAAMESGKSLSVETTDANLL